MSTEGERQGRPLTVYAEPIETQRSVEDASPEAVRDLTEEEISELQRSAAQIAVWSERYPHESVSPGRLSPAILDHLWQEWLADEALGRPTPEEAIRVLGSAFGHYLTAKLGMRWVQVTDPYGTAVCVRSSPGDVTVCPESVVAKRVESRGVVFFGALFEVTKEQLESSGA